MLDEKGYAGIDELIEAAEEVDHHVPIEAHVMRVKLKGARVTARRVNRWRVWNSLVICTGWRGW